MFAKIKILIFSIIGIVFVILIALVGGKENLIDAPRTKFTILNIFNITGISIKYAFWLFFCGILTSAAMVIPGVSGSESIDLSFLYIMLSVIAMGLGFALAYGVNKIKKQEDAKSI